MSMRRQHVSLAEVGSQGKRKGAALGVKKQEHAVHEFHCTAPVLERALLDVHNVSCGHRVLCAVMSDGETTGEQLALHVLRFADAHAGSCAGTFVGQHASGVRLNGNNDPHSGLVQNHQVVELVLPPPVQVQRPKAQ